MKNLLSILILVLVYSCSGQKKKDYVIETSDITNFWIAFDSIKSTTDKKKVFNELYIERASDLFKKMISLSGDISNAENYLESFEQYPKFWESLRKPTAELQNITSDIQFCFEKVTKIYPEFQPGNICVFIGPIAIQASVPPPKDVVYMGAEMNVPLNEIDLSEFEEDMSFIYLNDIKSTIIHETIHLQQKGEIEDLLELTIHEGSADFLAELFLGEPFKNPMYDYGKENELQLWTEFSQELNSQDWSKWFYTKSKTGERPADLGYFMGYMITKSYYNKAEDKNRAVKEIIEVTDSHQFLAESGYAEKFKK